MLRETIKKKQYRTEVFFIQTTTINTVNMMLYNCMNSSYKFTIITILQVLNPKK